MTSWMLQEFLTSASTLCMEIFLHVGGSTGTEVITCNIPAKQSLHLCNGVFFLQVSEIHFSRRPHKVIYHVIYWMSWLLLQFFPHLFLFPLSHMSLSMYVIACPAVAQLAASPFTPLQTQHKTQSQAACRPSSDNKWLNLFDCAEDYSLPAIQRDQLSAPFSPNHSHQPLLRLCLLTLKILN